MSRKIISGPAEGSEPSSGSHANAPQTPATVADRQDTGEVMLPGTPEYEELAKQLSDGKITAEEFVEKIKAALAKR